MAKQAGEAIDDGEAEPETFRAPTGVIRQLIEFAEDLLLVALGDPDSAITDIDAHRASPPAHADDDATAGGVLDGVGQQIGDNALEQHEVAAHHELRVDAAQAEALLRCCRGQCCRDSFEQLADREP